AGPPPPGDVDAVGLTRDARGGKWTALPQAAREADDVTALLGNSPYGPVTAYVGAQAQEVIFKRLQAPRLLHVATHGFFYEDQPEEPSGEEGLLNRGGGGAALGYARLRAVENPLLRSGIVLAGANR